LQCPDANILKDVSAVVLSCTTTTTNTTSSSTTTTTTTTTLPSFSSLGNSL
jgi:hypothetical protein